MELYKKHRPPSPKGIVGQDEALNVLGGLGKAHNMPHVLLLTGPSGTGKTTIARMIATMLKCGDADLVEANAALVRGIDFIRSLQTSVQMMPIAGKCRIWIIDECHQLTKDAQDAFLKLLEDQPSHAYFFLCTTDPAKLKKTIITRSTEIKLREIPEKDLVTLVTRVAAAEKIDIDLEVVLKIAGMSEGSARKALVLLNQIMAIPGKEPQIDALNRGDAAAPSRTLAQALMNGAKFVDIVPILKALKDDEPEGTRRMVLGYANAVVLNSGGKNQRALAILECFQFNLYDSGKAGLTLATYNACR